MDDLRVHPCCSICELCWKCLDKAVFRKLADFLNRIIPGCCPTRETDRLWADASKLKSKKSMKDHTPAGCMQYVAREHSLIGLYFAPTVRPTDLKRRQLLLILIGSVLMSLYLSLEVCRCYPQWTEGWYAWPTIIVINCMSAFAKTCYKCALRRTYFCSLHLPGLALYGCKNEVGQRIGFVFNRGVKVTGVGIAIRLGEQEVRLPMEWNAESAAWIYQGEDGISLPLRYVPLDFVVFQHRSDRNDKVLGRASVLVEDVWSRPGTRTSLSLDVTSIPEGKLEFMVCIIQEELISPMAMLAALLRPLLQFVPLRWSCILLCLPCCVAWWMLRSLCVRRRNLRGRLAPRNGLKGDTWRLLLRLVMITIILTAAIQFVVHVVHDGTAAKQRVINGLELFLGAKAFGWLVTEPGALGWTYLTMRTFCPVLLPEQSFETDDWDFSSAPDAGERSAALRAGFLGLTSGDNSPSVSGKGSPSSLQAQLLTPHTDLTSSVSCRHQRAASAPVCGVQ